MARLTDPPWANSTGLARIVAALGGPAKARIVGGAVRDALLGLPVADLDLATPLPPDVVTARLTAADVKVIPTGIAHGTVTAIADGEHVEVTTLREDVATDGRHATIAMTGDWRADAARRDFTINALSADPVSGEVVDHFGGLADLDAGRVRFVGDPATRIVEDHLRILRFYRFAARFNAGALDPDSHAAVVAGVARLKSLSRERVASELLRILDLPDPVPILRQMAADGVFTAILPGVDGAGADRVAHLITNEAATDSARDPVRRLIALLPPDRDAATALVSQLKLSTRVRKRTAAARAAPGADDVRQAAYWDGPDAVIDRALLTATPDGARAVRDALAGWTVPTMPMRGGDLVARGVTAGPDVARLLQAIEREWVAEGFPDGPAFDRIVDGVLATG